MKHNLKITPLLLTIALIGIVGCGKPNNDGRIPTIEYDGETTQATINTNNARPILTMAFDNAKTNLALASIFPLLTKEQRYNLTTGDQRHVGTLIGDCASIANGRANYDFEVESNGDLVGSIVFVTYCIQNVVINGRVNVTGKFSTASDPSRYKAMHWELPFVRITNGPYRMDTSGTFSVSETEKFEGINTVQIDLSMRDQNNNTYAADNQLLFHTPAENSPTQADELEIDKGRFYHHQYGFAYLVSTDGSLLISPGDSRPYRGGLKASANRGFTYMNVKNGNEFDYFVDIDGDQAAEDQRLNVRWTDFYNSWDQYNPANQ